MAASGEVSSANSPFHSTATIAQSGERRFDRRFLVSRIHIVQAFEPDGGDNRGFVRRVFADIGEAMGGGKVDATGCKTLSVRKT
jgi:hypothetical protein